MKIVKDGRDYSRPEQPSDRDEALYGMILFIWMVFLGVVYIILGIE